MEIFPRLLYEFRRHRSSLSSSSRESVKQTSLSAKKKNYLSKSHLQPASLPYISLFLHVRGKIQAILELVRQKRKSKLSFPNESQS